mgnify:FL=1
MPPTIWVPYISFLWCVIACYHQTVLRWYVIHLPEKVKSYGIVAHYVISTCLLGVTYCVGRSTSPERCNRVLLYYMRTRIYVVRGTYKYIIRYQHNNVTTYVVYIDGSLLLLCLCNVITCRYSITRKGVQHCVILPGCATYKKHKLRSGCNILPVSNTPSG